MTPATLVATFAARGVHLTVVGDRLHVDAPAGELTASDRDMIAASKAALLAVLRADEEVGGDSGVTPVPDGPCGLCGSPLTWVEDWPEPGTARWLCSTCAAWPAMSLAQAFASLTDAEATGGDDLARAVINDPAVTAARGRA